MQWGFGSRNLSDSRKQSKSIFKFTTTMPKYFYSLMSAEGKRTSSVDPVVRKSSSAAASAGYESSQQFHGFSHGDKTRRQSRENISTFPACGSSKTSTVHPSSVPSTAVPASVSFPDIGGQPTGRKGSFSGGSKMVSVLPEENNNSTRASSSSASSSAGHSARPAIENGSNTGSATAKPKKLCCDKCDGNHETDSCPYYKKSRENHPDGQKNFYKKMGGTSKLPGAELRSAKVIRQPGDGSCLFHSMSYGLSDGSTASNLRSEICSFINRNPSFTISETPLSDWVRWDSGSTCTDYARRMSRGAWGGGIEMACVAHIKNVNVHVYERSMFGFKRISAFDHPVAPETKKTVRVLYQGGVHYDALAK